MSHTTPRSSLAVSLLFGLLPLVAMGWFTSPVGAAPPNILLIVSNDQGKEFWTTRS